MVAPLDWGLGHASRCIPLIRQCLDAGFGVSIAASGRSLKLLQSEFPGTQVIEIPGYNITYPEKGSMTFHLLRALPRLMRVIRQERMLAGRIVKEKNVDLIVSDNRFGFYSPGIPSVFITHQLFVRPPEKFMIFRGIIRTINLHFIRKFSECWVPDTEESPGLSGALSHGRSLPGRLFYIGHLSRFFQYSGTHSEPKKIYDAAAVISGPEPERTRFEKMVLDQLRNAGLRWWAVLGRPGEQAENPAGEEVYPSLPARELAEKIRTTTTIICRPGYSSLMDLAALNARAVVVPTPGQTEQEYLAGLLKQNNRCVTETQRDFDLKKMLIESSTCTGMEGLFKPADIVDHILRALTRYKRERN